MTALIITAWILTGVIGYAGEFAYWQREYPRIAEESYREDMAKSMMFVIFGPINLLAVMFCTGFFKHGFKFY